MSSKIKVDTIENVAGSGNVSLGSGHNLVVPGDLTVDTSLLKVDSTNNRIGIGTASPTQATLHVAGGGVPARFESTSSATTYVQFGASGTSNYGQIAMNGNDMTLRTAYTDRMKIDGSGNIAAPAITLGNGTTYAAANTLDDYEEGTFTPSVGGNATYNSQIGKYVKIGRSVTIKLEIHINSIGTGSTSTITGIPYAADTEAPLALAKAQNLSSVYGDVTARISGVTLYYMTRQGNVASAATNTAIHGDGTLIQCSGSYVTGS